MQRFLNPLSNGNNPSDARSPPEGINNMDQLSVRFLRLNKVHDMSALFSDNFLPPDLLCPNILQREEKAFQPLALYVLEERVLRSEEHTSELQSPKDLV